MIVYPEPQTYPDEDLLEMEFNDELTEADEREYERRLRELEEEQ